jgi:hypothetical protein
MLLYIFTDWYTGNTPDLYPGDALLEYQEGHCGSVPPGQYWDSSQIRPRLLPFESFRILLPSINLPPDALSRY